MSERPIKGRLAIISSDINEFYSFFLPVASLAWFRCGWEPLCLLVGDPQLWNETPRARFALETTVRLGARTAFIPAAQGFRVATTAQVVRLLASALPSVQDEDYLLTSDVDMLPLDPKFFVGQDMALDFHVFSSDAYADLTKGLFPPKFPMCYLGASATVWRDVMGISSRDIAAEVANALNGRTDTWDNDEMYLTSKLYNHRIFEGHVERTEHFGYRKGKCDLMIRTWPSSRAHRRIDREVWGFDGSGGMIDCHCHRPGFEKTEVLRAIIARYFPGDTPWFDAYLSGYMNLGL